MVNSNFVTAETEKLRLREAMRLDPGLTVNQEAQTGIQAFLTAQPSSLFGTVGSPPWVLYHIRINATFLQQIFCNLP